MLEDDNGLSRGGDPNQPSWNLMKKNLVKQALIYIAGFFIIFTFPFVSMFLYNSSAWLTVRVIFMTVQGFTNSAIFISHKVHNIQREYSDVGVAEAIMRRIHPTVTLA